MPPSTAAARSPGMSCWLPRWRSSTATGPMAVHAPACPRTGPRPDDLYRHAPNKAALLDGVAEIVLAQLKVDIADRDWVSQLRTVAYRALARAHPHVVPLLVTRPLATPLALCPPAPCGHSKMSWSCSPAPVTADPRPCTFTGRFRVPARPRSQRDARTRRETRRNRRPAAAGPAPASHRRISPATQPRPRPGLLRWRR